MPRCRGECRQDLPLDDFDLVDGHYRDSVCSRCKPEHNLATPVNPPIKSPAKSPVKTASANPVPPAPPEFLAADYSERKEREKEQGFKERLARALEKEYESNLANLCDWQKAHLRSLVQKTKQRAEKNGLTWTLPENAAMALLGSPCLYSGLYDPVPVSAMIGRLDAQRGFTPENCVPCLKGVDAMKGGMHVFEFLNACSQTAHAARKRMQTAYDKHRLEFSFDEVCSLVCQNFDVTMLPIGWDDGAMTIT